MSFLFSYSYRRDVMIGTKGGGGSLCIVFHRLSLLVLIYSLDYTSALSFLNKMAIF